VETLECRERSVGRSVVDEDQLERPPARLERSDCAPVELLDEAASLKTVTTTETSGAGSSARTPVSAAHGVDIAYT
jgi:hypothetical protein